MPPSLCSHTDAGLKTDLWKSDFKYGHENSIYQLWNIKKRITSIRSTPFSESFYTVVYLTLVPHVMITESWYSILRVVNHESKVGVFYDLSLCGVISEAVLGGFTKCLQ